MEKRLTDLLEVLGSQDGVKRKQARETLVLLGEPALYPLRGLLASSDKRLRWEATKALGTMVDPGSLTALVELLSDEQSDIRWLAGTGLLNLGARSVGAVLQALVDHPDSLGYQQGAHRVLAGLSSDNHVLATIVRSVLEALSHPDPAVITSEAASALRKLEAL